MHSKGAEYIETLSGKKRKNDVIQFVGNIDGDDIFYANDYILVDKKNNKYYSGYFKYGKNGELIKHHSGILCFDNKADRYFRCSNFNNGIQVGDLKMKRIKKENTKLIDKQIEINVIAKGFIAETNRVFDNMVFKQKVINKDTNIKALKLNKNYNKFLLIFHGNSKGKLEDKLVNFNDIVNQISSKVKSETNKNSITKIKLVSCYGAMNDRKGNNLLECISKSFDSPVVVSVANSAYATANITLKDKNGIQKEYTYPVDYSPNGGKLISKYLSGTLQWQEKIDYKNRYFNHFYINQGKIYKIDYSLYNLIKYFKNSKDVLDIIKDGIKNDKSNTICEVQASLRNKYGFVKINHTAPKNNTKQIFNDIKKAFGKN